jgi:hypothetical protein
VKSKVPLKPQFPQILTQPFVAPALQKLLKPYNFFEIFKLKGSTNVELSRTSFCQVKLRLVIIISIMLFLGTAKLSLS